MLLRTWPWCLVATLSRTRTVLPKAKPWRLPVASSSPPGRNITNGSPMRSARVCQNQTRLWLRWSIRLHPRRHSLFRSRRPRRTGTVVRPPRELPLPNGRDNSGTSATHRGGAFSAPPQICSFLQFFIDSHLQKWVFLYYEASLME